MECALSSRSIEKQGHRCVARRAALRISGRLAQMRGHLLDEATEAGQCRTRAATLPPNGECAISSLVRPE